MAITYKGGNRLIGQDMQSHKVHTFTSGTSTFQITAGTGNVEYLVIAGGAGGGGCNNNTVPSGGGGAGGYRTATLSRGVGSYTVTVGAGGAGGVAQNDGADGSDSVFDTITSDGGGGGGAGRSGSPNTGRDGGSGGAGGYGSSGGSATAGQGNDGGDGLSAPDYCGGGGGGSGAVGQDGQTTGNGVGGAGGAGTVSSISGSSVTYAAGGGGGGFDTGGAGGSSGIGGAGKSYSNAANGDDGDINTGSGGGGTAYSGAHNGGAGGSGIVIVRYHSSDINATGGTITEIDAPLKLPTNPPNVSTFTETDTGKEYILNYGNWSETNQPSGSIAELLNDYSSVRKQHFWDWFSGSNLDSRWTLTDKTSANASEQRMSDSVDGGYIFESVNGHQSTLTFNNIRQYAHNGSGFIGICKRKNSSGNFGCGLKGDKATADGHSGFRNGARLIFKTGTSDIQAQSADTDGVTNTDTSVASSDTWRLFSAILASSSIKYFVDGVLEVTHTSSDQIPDAKLQPYVYAEGQGANSGGQIRYFEAYNT